MIGVTTCPTCHKGRPMDTNACVHCGEPVAPPDDRSRVVTDDVEETAEYMRRHPEFAVAVFESAKVAGPWFHDGTNPKSGAGTWSRSAWGGTAAHVWDDAPDREGAGGDGPSWMLVPITGEEDDPSGGADYGPDDDLLKPARDAADAALVAAGWALAC